VARVEADAEARVAVETFDYRRELLERAPDRPARSGTVLDQQPRGVGAPLEHLFEGRQRPFKARFEAAAEV
jgi:hypothetical protein